MRSVIFVGLLVFVVVMSASVGITWYAQQAGAKGMIEDIAKELNKDGKHFTYDSLESSGFPSHVNISIKNPSYNGDMGKLLDMLRAANPEAVPLLPEGTKWSNGFKLNGEIFFSINAMSDLYLMRIYGNLQSNIDINGTTSQLLTQSDGAIYCSTNLMRGSVFASLWNFNSLFRSVDELYEDFRMLDCSLPATTTLSQPDNERLASRGPARFYIQSRPLGKRHEFRIFMNAADMEVTEKGDEVASRLMKALNPNAFRVPVRYSVYGKQKFGMDLFYKGPSDPFGISNPNPNIELNLSQFFIENDAYQSNIHFYLSNQNEKNIRTLTLSSRAESTFTPVYDELMQDMIHMSINEVYAHPELNSAELQPYLQQYNPEQLFSIIAPAIPQFSTLQKGVLSADVKYEGDALLSKGEITLNDLEVSFAPYGLHMVGTGSKNNRDITDGQLNITCNNCQQMVHDLLEYSRKIQQVMLYFDPESASSLNSTEELENNVIAFLEEISGPDKSVLTYDIVAKNNQYTINTWPLNDIMPLFFQRLGPTLQQLQAPGNILSPQRQRQRRQQQMMQNQPKMLSPRLRQQQEQQAQ